MKALLENLKALGAKRLGIMGAVALVVLISLAVFAHSVNQQPLSLLYGNLSLREAGLMVADLKKAGIPYQLEAEGTAVFVAQNEVAPARLLLAQNNLPSSGAVGFSIFNHQTFLGETPFQERIAETRALEGELEQTIGLIQGVTGVKVNLVLPVRSPFMNTQQPVTASVLLSTASLMPLPPQSVEAIVNLVAASVPGLLPDNITIVDNHGDLLMSAGHPYSQAGALTGPEAMRQQMENQLNKSIEQMLAASLGEGNVRVVSNIQMTFAKIKQVSTAYNPNGQVLLSQQTSQSKDVNTQPPATTVANNIPGAPAQNPTPTSEQTASEQTNNYDISNVVQTTVDTTPKVSSISIAVMVNGDWITENGKKVWRPRSASELAQIKSLVETAIGYNKSRGDSVEVVSMPFTEPELYTAAKSGLFGSGSKSEIIRLIGNIIFAGVAVLAIWFVFRPMLKSLSDTLPLEKSELVPVGGSFVTEGGAEQGPGRTYQTGNIVEADGDQTDTDQSGDEEDGDSRMVTLSKIEGKLKISTLKQLSDLVDKYPEETISLIRGWLKGGE